MAIDERCEELAPVCVSLTCVIYTQRKVIYDFRTKLLKHVYETCLVDVDCNYREGNLVRAESICTTRVAITLTISQLNMLEKSIPSLQTWRMQNIFWGKKISKALVAISIFYFHFFCKNNLYPLPICHARA